MAGSRAGSVYYVGEDIGTWCDECIDKFITEGYEITFYDHIEEGETCHMCGATLEIKEAV